MPPYGKDVRFEKHAGGKVNDPRAFCAMIDLELPRGHQVYGGYRLLLQTNEQYDCFGEFAKFCGARAFSD